MFFIMGITNGQKDFAEGGTNDEDNLISFCKACHSRIHAKHGDRWRKHMGRE